MSSVAAGRATLISLAVCAAFLPVEAGALGLGDATVRSSLGQPLLVWIPVTMSEGEDVGCIDMRPRVTDDVPPVVAARYTLVQVGGKTRLEVTTPAPVQEPLMRLVVSAGCKASVTRQYALMIDPPGPEKIELPVQAPAPALAPVVVPPRRPARPPVARTPRPDASPGVAPDATPKSPPGATPTSTGVAAAVPRQRPVAPAPAKAHAPVKAGTAGAAGSGGDRIKLSSDLGTPSLRIAGDIVNPEGGPALDPQRLKALRYERARLMAILNDQNPDLVPTEREQALQDKLSAVTSDTQNLRQQVTTLNETVKALNESSIPAWLAWALGAIAALAVFLAGGMAWLLWRSRDRAANQPWWADQGYAEAPMAGEEPVQPPPRPAVRADANGGAPATVVTIPDTEVDDQNEQDLMHQFEAATAASSAATTAATVAATPPASSASSASSAAAPLSAADTVKTVRMDTPPRQSQPPVIPAPPAPVADDSARHGPSTVAMIDFTLPAAPATASRPEPVLVAPRLPEEASPAAAPDVMAPIMFDLELPPLPGTAPQPASPPVPLPSSPAHLELRDTLELPPFELDMHVPASPTPSPSPSPFELSLEPHVATPVVSAAATGPATGPATEFPAMGPDTILRLDAASLEGPTIPMTHGEDQNGDPASLQFRLIQFAAVLDQVEDMMRVQDDIKAIALLRRYVLRDEAIPTLMWLQLFALYKRVNKKPVYEALSEHFSRRYKRPMVKWDVALDSVTPQLPLAALPDIDGMVRRHWGAEAGLAQLEQLVCGHDQSDAVTFNAVLQRDLLGLAKVFPIGDSA